MNYYSGKDLARSFRVVRSNTLHVANEIPEDQYGFRATPDTRTVGETLAHIAASAGWQKKIHGAERKPHMTFEDFGVHHQESAAHAATLKTKAQIVAALEHDGAAFASWLESLDEGVLAEPVSFPAAADPPQKSRFEMILGVKEHEMHHRGQLMLIQRMIGIVPHLTRARMQRTQAQPVAH